MGQDDPAISYWDHRIKLENQYSQNLSDISICFRFYNLHIEHIFLMAYYDPHNFWVRLETILRWWDDGMILQLFQRLSGQLIQPDIQDNTDRLAPRQWHAYCLTYNRRLEARMVFIDGEKRLEDILEERSPAERDLPHDFLKGLGFFTMSDFPQWNWFTDIHIWNVTLGQDKVQNWAECKNGKYEENKIVDWSTANWTTKGIKIDAVNKSNVCFKRESSSKIFKFPFSRSYLNSVDLCHLLSGELTIAVDNVTAMEMLGKCDSHFSGLNDQDNEGIFINPYTRKVVDNARWAYNEPNNYGIGEDCTETNKDGTLNDVSCSQKQCTLCNLVARPQFELRGLCDSVALGRKYYLNVDENFTGVYDILGWKGSAIIWNKENKSWEIIETKNRSIIAFTNETNGEYPFGLKR